MGNLKSWYVRGETGQSYGPYSWPEIIRYSEEGRITFSTGLRCPFRTGDKWTFASDIAELSRHIAPPPVQSVGQPANELFFTPPEPIESQTITPRKTTKRGRSSTRTFIEIVIGGVLAAILYVTVLKDHVIPPMQQKLKEFTTTSKPASQVKTSTLLDDASRSQ